MTNYIFGSLIINANSAGLGYFVTAKETSLPVVKPTTSAIPRLAGMKKSGEMIDARTINVTIKVVGSSRADLVSRLDTLQQGLAVRSAQLCIHDDSRYFQSVDALSAPTKFQAGNGIVQCDVQCVFTAYDPFAYSASPSTSSVALTVLTLINGLWNFPAIPITGGGTIYSYPFIRITNDTGTGSTTLSAGLTSGSNYTSISVNATVFGASAGDTLILTHGGTSQTVTIATQFGSGTTTISVNSFMASTNYVSGDTVQKNTQWTSITVTQTTDNLAISAVSTTAVLLPVNNGDYVDVQCDPSAVNGWSIQTNNTGKFSDPIGLFPVMEPTLTTFNIAIASGSQVAADVSFNWTPRYLS